MSEWANERQANTKPVAARHGEVWTTAELEFVTEFANETAEELALALGRTLFAIQSIRAAVAEGKRPAAERATAGAYRGWVEGQQWWD